MAKALGWAHCTVPDIPSGMMHHSGSTTVTILQKQPIQAVPCVVLHHAPYKMVFYFLHLEQPTSFSHILITYVLVFLGIMTPFYG